MTKSKLNFCVTGVGRAGLVHAINLSQRITGASLVALCDGDAQRLEKAGQELGVQSLFRDYREVAERDDIDAVVVTTPTYSHCEIACLCIERGKHVFMEKPMAVTVDECRRINSAVARAGVKFQIGFMRRFDQRFRQARDTIASGQMGRVMLIKSTGRGPGGPGPWMYDLRKSNGVAAEVNSHDLDTLRWLSGQEFKQVYAQGKNFKCHDAREAWPDFYDSFAAVFTFVDGAIGFVDGACPVNYGYDARVEVLCERGLLLVGGVEQPGFQIIYSDGQVTSSAVKSWRTLFKDAYLAEMEHFVECIYKDQKPIVGGEDGQRAVEAVVALNQSISKGEPVQVRQEVFL